MRHSVFFDSNVWFSAFYKRGICSHIIEKSISLGLQTYISELVLEEVIRNIQAKIPQVLPLFTAFLKENKINVLKNPSIATVLLYEGMAARHDLPILVAAIEFRCTHFISGNLRDFKLEKIKKVSKIVLRSPKEYQEIIEKL